mgnify:CR=1 FL=1
MEVLKEHKGKVFTSALIAIIGVGLDVVPYFSVANIINNKGIITVAPKLINHCKINIKIPPL